MKRILLITLMVLGFAVQGWGQEGEQVNRLTDFEIKYLVENKATKDREVNKKNAETPKDTIIYGRVNRRVKTGDTNTYVVEYNFKGGVYHRNNIKLKVNTPIVYKIKNINRLAYEIKITSKDSLLAETFLGNEIVALGAKSKEETAVEVIQSADGVVKNPKILGIEFMKEEDIDNKEKGVKLVDFTETIPKINELNVKLEKEEKELDSLNRKKDTLVAKIILLDEIIKTKQNGIDNQYDTKEVELTIEKGAAEKAEKELQESEIEVKEDLIKQIKNSIKKETEKLEYYVKKFNQDNLALQESFSNLKESYDVITKLKHIYQEVVTISSDPHLSKDRYKNHYKSRIEKKTEYISQHKDKVFAFQGHYNDFNIKYSYLKYNPSLTEILNYGGQIKLYSQAEYLKELADNMNNNVDENNIRIIAETLEKLLYLLNHDDTYEIVSAPIQPLNDVAIFDIHIRKKGNNNPITDEKTFRHREFTYGGTRLDFSLGLAASKFHNTPVYELGSIKDTITGIRETRISNKSDDLVVPSLLGLVTMSYRKTGYITFGASAGLGIDVVNGKIQLSNFFGGPTVLFGKFDRLFLTVGGSVRNVGQLKSGYIDGSVLPNGSNDINDFITDKYKVGWFVALTYNLTKGARDNYKRLKEL